MAARTSFYRPTGTSRRTNARQLHDHDVFEGLPIRRWAKQWIWIANAPETPPTNANMTNTTSTAADLPLPKDTHLLTPMSQTLLQAARNGTLAKPVEDEVNKEETETNPESHRLFLTNKWTCAPRDNEPPEVEYLSKITRGVKRKINGKFVDIEDDIPLGNLGGDPGVPMDNHTAAALMKRRPPPPRRKGPKGRKPGFKKMVTFAEDGTALPSSQEGVAMPPSQLDPAADAVMSDTVPADTSIKAEPNDLPPKPSSSESAPQPETRAHPEGEAQTDADVEMSDAAAMPSSSSPLPIAPIPLASPTSDPVSLKAEEPAAPAPTPVLAQNSSDVKPLLSDAAKSPQQSSQPASASASAPSPVPLSATVDQRSPSPAPLKQPLPGSSSLPPKPPTPLSQQTTSESMVLIPKNELPSSLPEKPAFLKRPSNSSSAPTEEKKAE